MRVLIASAHFPPNFVSGGTLVPRHVASELRRRGHDVHVFAGWRGHDREPLDEWDEVDSDGVHVHWVNTTPWLSDLDDKQFDNPQVASAFATHVERVEPEVINFHSIQGMGVGAIDAARSRALPTAVVMHDFWWWCGRMFMAARDDRPCSPVVECGVCDCSADAAWLSRRNRRLRESLAGVDRVVCVSHVLARVARANGVDEERLVVIENGIPSAPDPSSRSSFDSDRHGSVSRVRFVYAGGPDTRKGPYLLSKALGHIEDLSGWSLTAYGWPVDLGEAGQGRVDRRPPFSPDQVASVLQDADVVVIPSIMRESYSILARQALSFGVPVLTTDCLGPEEVVTEEVNGLIVPSADPAALGTAMRRLITEKGLLDRLRAAPPLAAIGTVEDAAVEYEKLLMELTDQTRSRPSTSQARVGNVCFVVGITGAPLRYRAYLPAEALADRGVECHVRHYRHPDVAGLAAEADVVVFYRVPATVQIVNLIAGLRDRGVPTVFDVDDLIFDPDIGDEIPAVRILSKSDAEQWMEGVRRYRATLDLCDAFIGSTNELASHAKALTGLPSFRFPNGVGRFAGRLADAEYRRPRSPGAVRIGYLSGTNTHDYDWRHIEPAVARIMDDHPDVELWLVGLIEPTTLLERHSDRVVRRPLLAWTELPAVVRDLDVNLAPLAPGWRFNQAKSAIKWVEAALVATPTVASPTEPFREVIDDGHNGLLAETPDEWYKAIDSLVKDEDLRRRLGERARREALLDLCPSVQGDRYMEILGAVRSQPVPASKTATWRAVFDDEPCAPFELDAYALPGEEAVQDLTPRVVTLRDRIADTRVTLRERGIVPAAARALRYSVSALRRRVARFR